MISVPVYRYGTKTGKASVPVYRCETNTGKVPVTGQDNESKTAIVPVFTDITSKQEQRINNYRL